ncbi:MAG: Crp/Fnr family transcriptional regulator [Spirochaetes bacterium]|nr:Crp/Fnr family transcriptional regulator [Spirochaetota bacterium]
MDTLKSIDIFSGVSLAAGGILLQYAHLRTYKKNEYIFRDKEKTDHFYCIVDGTVSLYKLSALMEKRGIFIYGNGATLNEDSIDGKPPSVNACALRNSKLLLIKRIVLREAFTKDPTLFEAFCKSMAMKTRRLYHLMKNTTTNLRGDRRIAAKLWKLSRDFGKETELGTEINFDLSIAMFAEFLGSQRETVSRQVKLLCDSGVIIVRKSRFTIPCRNNLLEYFNEDR